jgi:hypothetical protein
MNSLTKSGLLSNVALDCLFDEAKCYVNQAGRSGVAAHEVERNIFDYVLKIGHQMLGYFFQLQGSGDVGDKIDLPNGSNIKRLNQSSRMYRSLLGDFQLTRYGYGMRKKQAILCYPVDTRLQLPQEEYSYPLQEIFHLLTTEVPYNTSKEILKKLLNIKVTVDSMERVTQHCGEEVGGFREAQLEPVPETEGALFVATADGKGVPIRHAKDTLRISEQRLKTGPKLDRKRMAVVGAAYTIERYSRTPHDILEALFSEPGPSLSKQGKVPKRPHPKNKHVVAYLTQTIDGTELKASDATFAWLKKQIELRGINVTSGAASQVKSKIHLAMMDGQESLWNKVKQLRENFPHRIWVEILDLMHVNSYLWEAACAFHSGDKKKQLIFMKTKVLEILEGRVAQVVDDLRNRATERRLNKSLQATIVKVCRYFENNQHRMKYHEYLKAGYPIATGVIEGACRHYVKDRMERAGMRWTIKGAQAMLNMRSVSLNGDCDKFNQFRIRHQLKKLYPHADNINAIDWPFAA